MNINERTVIGREIQAFRLSCIITDDEYIRRFSESVFEYVVNKVHAFFKSTLHVIGKKLKFNLYKVQKTNEEQ